MNRVRALDGLRGIAVLMVLAYHYTAGYQHVVHAHAPGLLFRFRAGQFGVNLFFMISGYVILMTTERARSVRDFVIARFIRLYPPFVFAVLFTGTILCMSGFNPQHLTPVSMLTNLVMATYLLGMKQIDSVYWTLSYELLFYALMAIGVLALRVRRVELIALAWLLLSYGTKFLLHVPPPATPHPAFTLSIVTGSEVAYLFVAGMMIRRLHSGHRGILTWAVLCFSAVPVLVPLLQAMSWSRADSSQKLVYGGMMLSFAALVYHAPLHRWAALCAGPLPFLGDISYSLYLVHQMAGYWVIDWLESRHVDPNLAVLTAAMLAIILATLMRNTVELHAQRILRRMAFHPSPAHPLPGTMSLAP